MLKSKTQTSPFTTNRTYYGCWYRLGGVDRYLIWFSSGRDGVFVDANQKIPNFLSLDALTEYAMQQGISIEMEEPNLHDLDKLEHWLRSGNALTVDCHHLLGAWNLFDDVSRSCAGRFDSNRKLTNRIYKTLFWGSNLPAVTPEGECFVPVWTKGQIKIMRRTLRAGLSLFLRSLLQG